jgi:hypothetical protein
VPGEKNLRLPPGYRLDLVGDTSVIVLLRENGTFVGRFTRYADPQEIRQAAEEDCRLQGEDRRD